MFETKHNENDRNEDETTKNEMKSTFKKLSSAGVLLDLAVTYQLSQPFNFVSVPY